MKYQKYNDNAFDNSFKSSLKALTKIIVNVAEMFFIESSAKLRVISGFRSFF